MIGKNSGLKEIEQIIYSDLEPFFQAIAKEVGRHAYGIEGRHLSYRHPDWGDECAPTAIYQRLKEKDLSELLWNTDEALDRAAFLGWYWLHSKGLMPEWEMDSQELAWHHIATQGMR